MFYNTPMKSFSGDLSSLVNGNHMFYGTRLESFSGDLRSLIDGFSMFQASALTSFTGDLSSLINGTCMFSNTGLKSFSGDLSSLVNSDSMFMGTPSLASFSGDLSSLVNGSRMFVSSSLASFSGDLSSLVNGEDMFYGASLASFSGDLSSLVNGSRMFYPCNLDLDSVEIICDTIPNKADLQTWNTSTNSYEPYTDGSDFKYRYLNENRNFTVGTITASYVAKLMIHWNNPSQFSDAEKATITALFEKTAQDKGWTIITNGDMGGTYAPAVTALDGTVQTYIYVRKEEADEDTATYVDPEGKLWTLETAEAIIGPNVVYWSVFANKEDAITEWELTPYTKPVSE